jgi:hypothetical protein
MFNNNCENKEDNKCCYGLDKRTKNKKHNKTFKRKVNFSLLPPMFTTFKDYRDGLGNIEYESFCFKYYCPNCLQYWSDKCDTKEKSAIQYRVGGFITFFKINEGESFYDAYTRLKQIYPRAVAIHDIYIPEFNVKKV